MIGSQFSSPKNSDQIATKMCPKTSHNAFLGLIMYSKEGLPKSLEALYSQHLQVWRLAESNHGHMDFQYYVVYYVSGTYGDQ